MVDTLVDGSGAILIHQEVIMIGVVVRLCQLPFLVHGLDLFQLFDILFDNCSKL